MNVRPAAVIFRDSHDQPELLLMHYRYGSHDVYALPGGSPAALLNKDYLRSRANLIRFDKSMGVATAGEFAGFTPQGLHTTEGRGTTHMSIVDKNGELRLIKAAGPSV